MAVSGIIEFFASSGSPAGSFLLDTFVAGSGTEYNRIGWFGANGPGSYITISTYQDRTFMVDEEGSPVIAAINAASGELTNLKYINSTQVDPNASGTVLLTTITEQDATLLVHFTHPTGAATTVSNIFLKSVNLNAASGVPDDTVGASGVNIYAFEVAQDSTWTKISNDASPNSIQLGDRASSSIYHDFHIGISASPLLTGEKNNFALVFELEYV